MNVWFGISWGAPMCAILDHVPTPVGATCLHCEEAIAAHDNGWGQCARGPWYHIECFTRMMVGSVGHQLGVCACNGGKYEDSPYLTTREAAKAAFEQAQVIKQPLQQPYIVCPRCGSVSHNPNDIVQRYCGRCHRFHVEG